MENVDYESQNLGFFSFVRELLFWSNFLKFVKLVPELDKKSSSCDPVDRAKEEKEPSGILSFAYLPEGQISTKFIEE